MGYYSDLAHRLERKNLGLREKNEQLKKQIEKMKCCGNCKHRNGEEVVETCRKLKKYTLIKGFCSEWELAEV